MVQGLHFGPFRDSWAHLCIDMQAMFAQRTAWHTPWLDRILPNVVTIAELDPYLSIFTRFLPARRAEDAPGSLGRYYQRWPTMTRDQLDPDLINLVPQLARFVPPARVCDKQVMSAWNGQLHDELLAGGITTLIVTGAETEICVLASIMGAINLGYRVILIDDAVCSGADPTHDAMLGTYSSRFGMQIEVVGTRELIAARRDGLF